jgi:hypothetical protein
VNHGIADFNSTAAYRAWLDRVLKLVIYIISRRYEEVVQAFPKVFPGTILVPKEEKTIAHAKAPYEGLSIWSDGSRLENGRTGARYCVVGLLRSLEKQGNTSWERKRGL